MYLAYNEKWKKQITEGIKQPNQEILEENDNYNFLGILEAETMKKKDEIKVKYEKNKETSGNQAPRQKSQQNNK